LKLLQLPFCQTSKVVSAIHTRKIRFHLGLDPSYKDEILTKGELQPDYVNEVNLITGHTSIPVLSGWTVTIKPLDIRIRKAMNYGFDRQKLVLFAK
jgi:peptide/nickel transport system substrate-binding protein